jgi:hypothetical protein
MRRWAILSGVIAAVFLAGAAPGPDTGVKVSGTVCALAPGPTPQKKVKKPVPGAAVHLRDLPAGWDRGPSRAPLVLHFRKGRIVPEFACLQVGQPLVVRAAKGEAFALRAHSPARGEIGATAPPDDREFRDAFPRPDDRVSITCALHPTARARLQVVPTPVFTLCDERGKFVLPRRLPKGTHVLKAFLPGAGWGEKVITLRGDEGSLRVELELGSRFGPRTPPSPPTG